MVYKFVAHFLWIATSMMHAGNGTGMWDEEDGFFYDVLRLPDGSAQRLKVRSMVGLLPLCAVTVFDGDLETRHPDVAKHLRRFLEARPELRAFIHDPVKLGYDDRRLAAVLDESKLRRVLGQDARRGRVPQPVRNPVALQVPRRAPVRVQRWRSRIPRRRTCPHESDTGMFGGNSNWRGPIWMPMNALLIRALLQLYLYYGNDFTVECPTGSGNQMNLYEVSEEINRRLSSIFLRDENGGRPVFGGATKFQEDPKWRDHLQFYEYFHGDNGAGLGANHQTGWTGLIARGMHLFASTTAEQTLEEGKLALATPRTMRRAARCQRRRERAAHRRGRGEPGSRRHRAPTVARRGHPGTRALLLPIRTSLPGQRSRNRSDPQRLRPSLMSRGRCGGMAAVPRLPS